MSTPVNRRALVTLLVFLLSLIMLITSLLMFLKSYHNATATVHTVIGFIFLAAACWHLVNNLSSLKKYLHPNAFISTSSRFGWSPRLAVIFSFLLLALTAWQIEPFKGFHRWGTSLRIADSTEGKDFDSLEYTAIRQNTNKSGRPITIDFKKGPAFHWPQYAIWLEKSDGTFVQPLYVTQSVATNTFKNTVWLKEGIEKLISNPFDKKDMKFENIFEENFDANASNNRFRPESLPVFLHKLQQNHEKTKLITEEQKQTLDGYTGATVLDNYLLSSRLKPKNSQQVEPDQYTVFLEINQSFDFNEYYSSDRFPDDQVYSGDGFSAQPSVIYKANIDFGSSEKLYPMTLVGHGHHSGQDGNINPDTSQLTTALAIVDRVIVDTR